ncbi:MAG TPA: biotin carboxylase N-terminal domain-containing protein [Caulobacteraceae bacterium]|jgi:hypothetical protein
MPIEHILIANRGEIAIRIARAAAELGIETTAVFAGGDGASLHVRAADRSKALPEAGAAGYLGSVGLSACRPRRRTGWCCVPRRRAFGKSSCGTDGWFRSHA